MGNAYVRAETMLAKLVESHRDWADLAQEKQDKGEISIWQTSDPRLSSTYVRPEEATKMFNIPEKSSVLPAAPRPAPYERWYYLDSIFKLLVVPGDVVEVE